MPKLRVFVSATTRDLNSYGHAATARSRDQEHEPIRQDTFDVQPDCVTIARIREVSERDTLESPAE